MGKIANIVILACYHTQINSVVFGPARNSAYFFFFSFLLRLEDHKNYDV